MTSSIADILERAADLIEPEGAWTRLAFGRDAAGESIGAGDHPRCVCWCVTGAVRKIVGSKESAGPALKPLMELIGAGAFTDILQWNDAPGRTQSEVVSKLREAAALARGKVL